MEPYYQTESGTIYQGHAIEILKQLAPNSVQCVVTSPPYWGLRDYGVDKQIGLEDSLELYVEHIIDIFQEIKRVLRSDGTLWLNLGDTYATGAGKVGNAPGGGPQGEKFKRYFGKHTPGSLPAMNGLTQPNRMPIPGLKPKDLVGIPWKVAFALREDGWYLRSDIIWAKPNPMPESVADRPTKAHEYIFLMSNGPQYYYDVDAIREPALYGDHPRNIYTPYQPPGQRAHKGIRKRSLKVPAGWDVSPGSHGKIHKNGRTEASYQEAWDKGGRNKRSVWTVSTRPFAEAHFATFPPDLIKPCILAGAPEGGVVLDPFFGAGTTGVVCEKLNRHWIGIELNPEYCEMAKKRIEAETVQMKLFKKARP